MQVGEERVAGEFSTDPLVLSSWRHRLSASRLLSWSFMFAEDSLEVVDTSELATDFWAGSGLGVTLLPGVVNPEIGLKKDDIFGRLI